MSRGWPFFLYSARCYRPSAGRFTTQDTWVGSPTNPQTLNRYAYVMNNPVKFSDPSGHMPCDSDGVCGYGDPGSGSFDNSGGDNSGGDTGGYGGYGGDGGNGGDNGGGGYSGGGGDTGGGDTGGGDSGGGGKDPVPLTPQQILDLRKQAFLAQAGNAPSVDQYPNGQYPDDSIDVLPMDQFIAAILIPFTDGASEAFIAGDTIETTSVTSAEIAGENGNLESSIYNDAASSRVTANDGAVEDPTPPEPGASSGSGVSEDTGNSTSYARPSSYRKGVRDQVWENAKGTDGQVRDPLTGNIMDKSEPWDMGHKPGYEFRKLQQSAQERGISRKQFLDEFNNPDHYRPELPSSNRSHAGEDMTDNYFGP